MIEIIDNFLDNYDLEKLKEYVSDTHLLWQYGTILPEKILECDPIENYQLINVLYDNKKYGSQLNLIVPLLKKLNAEVLLKAKINLTWRRERNIKIGWHTDIKKDPIPENYKTAIYYLNTNNGSTIVDNTIVECIENRIVIFDASTKHTGVTCTDKSRKLLLNINYY
jgi:hypothetical protein